jgi:multiple sugar transport system permease protein
VFPTSVTLHSFQTAIEESYWLLKNFWGQMGNSFYIGVTVAFLTLAIGTLTAFTITRMRIKHAWMLTNAALLTYMIPMSFLAIPFYSIMGKYGLTDNPIALIAVEVTFATPYAIFIFKQYGASIPHELDEAARIDGASPPQIFYRIYLPLMAPALVAIGTYALLLSWNEYLYAFLLLSSDANITVPVGLGKFLNSDEAPWNYLMAASIIYALPPMIIYYVFRRKMNSGLTMGGVKG